MKQVTRIIGAVLLVLAALAMVAGDLLASPGHAGAERQRFETFVLHFDMFAPPELRCDASGVGVRSRATRDLAGKPVLRVSGNAADADIRCRLPDGPEYKVLSNRDAYYTAAAPTEATVTFVRGKPAMTTVLRIHGMQDVYEFKSFVQVD